MFNCAHLSKKNNPLHLQPPGSKLGLLRTGLLDNRSRTLPSLPGFTHAAPQTRTTAHAHGCHLHKICPCFLSSPKANTWSFSDKRLSIMFVSPTAVCVSLLFEAGECVKGPLCWETSSWTITCSLYIINFIFWPLSHNCEERTFWKNHRGKGRGD